MYFFDLGLIIKFYLVLFLIGLLFLPLTTRIFSSFFDKGYIFSKVLGIVILSYALFTLGILHILPFSFISILLLIIILIVVIFFFTGFKTPKLPNKKLRRIWVFEEILFLSALLFWAYIKGFQPDINGLEKFMDFGFVNSILRTEYFPPIDMWFAKEPINYYYFGHLITAMLTKLSGIESFITYNLMIAALFAFTFVGSFSIVVSFSRDIFKKVLPNFFAGILGALLVTLAGNLHTIYAFFQSYDGEHPVPFWTLRLLSLDNFGAGYWYPNATRFIEHTIHEFPSYSFVVSDLHGHVLDIPIVLLTIALLYVFFQQKNIDYKKVFLLSFLPAVMYMTNAWDGIIYGGLITILIIVKNIPLIPSRKKMFSKNALVLPKSFILNTLFKIALLGIGFFIFTLPFNTYFKPFASGIGFICAPGFLEGKTFGPLLFEKDHCDRSPLYQLFILWGFFYITLISLIIFLTTQGKKLLKKESVIFALILTLYASILILMPEFIYAKDIYPLHYRANTMFKLGYQAFIMLSLVSAFAITLLIVSGKKVIFIPLFTILVGLVMIYPFFSIESYFGKITPNRYQGINGISYLSFRYPDDYEAILWLRGNIEGQPVIAEAQGDSYTDYARISANTGLPTILGWTVHEWLWRGSYSIPEPRIDDVRALYEDDLLTTQKVIDKYNVSLVFIGSLEREKYPNLNEEKFKQIGTPIFSSGSTTIYRLR